MSEFSNDKIKKQLEAILFMAGNPVSVKDLAEVLKTDPESIIQTATKLREELADRGIVVSENKGTYQMATNPEVSTTVKNYLQLQLREKLTEAAIETLSIITYKQPVAKVEIEAIRGVNCQYILKLLLQRGLVEKVSSGTDTRVNLYQTTHEFLNHLGIRKLDELPDFDEIVKNMALPEELPNTEKAE